MGARPVDDMAVNLRSVVGDLSHATLKDSEGIYGMPTSCSFVCRSGNAARMAMP